MASSYYAILGVTPESDPEVIDAAYRALMKKYHPDVRGRPNDRRSQEINEAYAVLKDEAKRRAYDEELKSNRNSPVVPGHFPAASNARSDERTGSTTKACPDCAETVQAGARICRYCGHEFDGTDESSEPADGESPKPIRWKLLAAVGSILSLLWLLGLCSYEPATSDQGDAVGSSDHVETARQSSEGQAETSSPARPVPARARDWDVYEDNLTFGGRVLWNEREGIDKIVFYQGSQAKLLEGCAAPRTNIVQVLSVDEEQQTFRGRAAGQVSTYHVPYDQVPEVVGSWVGQMTQEGTTLKVGSSSCGASGAAVYVTALERPAVKSNS